MKRTYRYVVITFRPITTVITSPIVPPISLTMQLVVILLTETVIVGVTAFGDVMDTNTTRRPIWRNWKISQT
mgnify:CR=1 FL=1